MLGARFDSHVAGPRSESSWKPLEWIPVIFLVIKYDVGSYEISHTIPYQYATLYFRLGNHNKLHFKQRPIQRRHGFESSRHFFSANVP